jgi:putative tricarboxylic transport membrane protein
MYIGNVLLLILNLPLVAVFAQLLKMPGYAMFPLILGVSIVGVYTAASSMFQLGLLALFGSSATRCASSTSRPRRWCWAWCSATSWRRRCASR